MNLKEICERMKFIPDDSCEILQGQAAIDYVQNSHPDLKEYQRCVEYACWLSDGNDLDDPVNLSELPKMFEDGWELEDFFIIKYKSIEIFEEARKNLLNRILIFDNKISEFTFRPINDGDFDTRIGYFEYCALTRNYNYDFELDENDFRLLSDDFKRQWLLRKCFHELTSFEYDFLKQFLQPNPHLNPEKT